MKEMPFGAKLQNHPLDNRLNDEVRRQYGVNDSMLPVRPADLGDGRKARKISQELLSEDGMDPHAAARFVVASIERYIEIITENQNSFLQELEGEERSEQIVALVESAFNPKSDARLFEVVSYALLRLHYMGQVVSITLNGVTTNEVLTLYRTGRTNANDGGIDFVLKPIGRFFQVTEDLNFRKYFLDFEKINRFPLTFVIKTDLSPKEAMVAIRKAAVAEVATETVDRYMDLFEEVYTLNELRDILRRVAHEPESIQHLKGIIVESFKLEYGLLD
jgi:hypothetical protein